MKIDMERMDVELTDITMPLWVSELSVTERMNKPFDIELQVRSESPELDLEAPIGRLASFHMSMQMAGNLIERSWTGLCTHFAQTRVESEGASTYRVRLRPQLWALSQRTNYRLFQHAHCVDIVESLLDEWEIERDKRLDMDRYPVLELRTQYGESDLAFITRLLEEAGISFFFAAGDAKLILADRPQDADARLQALPYIDDPSLHAVNTGEFATGVHITHRALTAAYAHRDHDFRRPGLDLTTRSEAASEAEARWERFDYTPGGFLHERNSGGETPHADDKGPGRHDGDHGSARAELAQRRSRADKRLIESQSNVIDLAPGRVFAISDHPHPAMADTLLALENRIERRDGEWRISTRAVPTQVAYHPPQSVSRPRIEAVQTAVVVGPAGEEIHTDEFGRVRVQFPWDRYGNSDEESSCWMRVNQGWAGAGYGSINLPRIGQEVLVAFLDGNPDHPIVVGRVFNGAEVVPYKLPENKTVSTWRTNSSPTTGGFNELRFEDAAGRELVYFQAEKDSMHLVKNDEMQVVGGSRSRLVRGDETKTIAQNKTAMVKGAVSTTIGDNETATVGKSQLETIGDTKASIVGKMFNVTVARSLAGPLGQAFGGMVSAMGPVLANTLTSTLGEVPNTALGAPFKGSEHGPMASLAKDLLPKALGLLGQGAKSIAEGGGRPATNIAMVDEKIVLSTGGASITLDGDDIILSAKGKIQSTSKKDTNVFAQAGSITIQGGPMVYINPGEKSAEAMQMAQAAKTGAAFIGGGS